jgi:hypothetical protein
MKAVCSVQPKTKCCCGTSLHLHNAKYKTALRRYAMENAEGKRETVQNQKKTKTETKIKAEKTKPTTEKRQKTAKKTTNRSQKT